MKFLKDFSEQIKDVFKRYKNHEKLSAKDWTAIWGMVAIGGIGMAIAEQLVALLAHTLGFAPHQPFSGSPLVAETTPHHAPISAPAAPVSVPAAIPTTANPAVVQLDSADLQTQPQARINSI